LRVLFSGTHPGQSPGSDMERARHISARMVENVTSLRSELGGRWLDVGFGNGSLLATAAEFGFDVVGLAFRERSVRQLRELGFEAHAMEFTSYRPAERVDVISMADVLEHMAFPRPALQHAFEILDDGGLLLVSMPNADSFVWQALDRKQQNPYWGE